VSCRVGGCEGGSGWVEEAAAASQHSPPVRGQSPPPRPALPATRRPRRPHLSVVNVWEPGAARAARAGGPRQNGKSIQAARVVGRPHQLPAGPGPGRGARIGGQSKVEKPRLGDFHLAHRPRGAGRRVAGGRGAHLQQSEREQDERSRGRAACAGRPCRARNGWDGVGSSRVGWGGQRQSGVGVSAGRRAGARGCRAGVGGAAAEPGPRLPPPAASWRRPHAMGAAHTAGGTPRGPAAAAPPQPAGARACGATRARAAPATRSTAHPARPAHLFWSPTLLAPRGGPRARRLGAGGGWPSLRPRDVLQFLGWAARGSNQEDHTSNPRPAATAFGRGGGGAAWTKGAGRPPRAAAAPVSRGACTAPARAPRASAPSADAPFSVRGPASACVTSPLRSHPGPGEWLATTRRGRLRGSTLQQMRRARLTGRYCAACLRWAKLPGKLPGSV
jgi:hypothetical protein